jgi:DNA (cytosine-5)-methyltransferase 1
VGRHSEFLKDFYQRARSARYDVCEPVVIDARDHGLPQRRKRVFILGIRKDLNCDDLSWPPAPTHGNGAARQHDKTLKPWISCATAFRNLPKDDENDVHMKHSKDLVEAFRKTPPNGGSRRDSGRMLDCHKEHDGHKDVYGRIDRPRSSEAALARSRAASSSRTASRNPPPSI